MKNSIAHIAVFASGNGSNFQAIDKRLREMESPPARIVVCISNNPHPGAFDYAAEHGIRHLRLSPKMFDSAEEYSRQLLETLTEHDVDIIVLAGYMRLLPAEVVAAYRDRILNIHPALLPEFGGQGMYGMNVHRAVLAAGRSESGATVHLVDEHYDTGRIVAQLPVPVMPDDTPESLAARVLEAEHELFPQVVIEMAREMVITN